MKQRSADTARHTSVRCRGKILQNIKKAKSSNPVFILDEIDKVRSDYRGDPSSALLEVLDPEQNSTFGDNYLEIDYDLSKVLFIATANSLDTIHPALRDRMEIIEVTGYTVEEKLQIAIQHLVPKQIQEHGLKPNQVKITKDALLKIIEGYTRESGVRSLERRIGSVVRSVAKAVAMEEAAPGVINAPYVVKVLGVEVFDEELYQDNSQAGVVTGLAWTQVGGDILFVESSVSRGKGILTLSGQLGDVMKESAVAALSYLKSNAASLGIDHRVFQQYDLHVHVPAGAVPKDGPSAGITMLTSLASIFTQRKVKSRMAMTGEITLRGKVLPVGGIKEKILAAKRGGIKEIILSAKNKRDINEIEKQYVKGLTFHYVDHVDEVLKIALTRDKVKKTIGFCFRNSGEVMDAKLLTPRQIVAELDKYIVGQFEAKRNVAIALRNRWRRMNVSSELRGEIIPNNILMIGATGVGKTEIARRLAKLADAPFVKVEASKFTEVGYVGRDVESMVRDLVEQSVNIVKARKRDEVKEKASQAVEEVILDALIPPLRTPAPRPAGAVDDQSTPSSDEELNERTRKHFREKIRNGEMDDRRIEINIKNSSTPNVGMIGAGMMDEVSMMNLQEMLNGMMPRKQKKRKVTVSEARRLLLDEEVSRLIDMDEVKEEALRRAEDSGIIFIDEIDKIASGGKKGGGGPDVSREGVQRDLLPIVEGSTVNTKYGAITTDHVLFIAAGAFHVAKPSDLIPELQGRFPIRVELDNLTKRRFYSNTQ